MLVRAESWVRKKFQAWKRSQSHKDRQIHEKNKPWRVASAFQYFKRRHLYCRTKTRYGGWNWNLRQLPWHAFERKAGTYGFPGGKRQKLYLICMQKSNGDLLYQKPLCLLWPENYSQNYHLCFQRWGCCLRRQSFESSYTRRRIRNKNFRGIPVQT